MTSAVDWKLRERRWLAVVHIYCALLHLDAESDESDLAESAVKQAAVLHEKMRRLERTESEANE